MPKTTHCLFGGTLLAAGLTGQTAQAQEFVPEAYAGSPYVAYFFTGAYDGDAYQYSYAYAYTPAEAFQSHEVETPLSWEASTEWDPTAAVVTADSGTSSYLNYAYAYGYFSGYFTVSEDAVLRVNWDFADMPLEGDIDGSIVITDLDSGLVLIEVNTFLGDPRSGLEDIDLVAGVSYSMFLNTSIFGVEDSSTFAAAELVEGEPCRADIDGDGSLTIFDFLAFQNAFDAGDLLADFDGDGELTLFDFLSFQNAFSRGCD